MGFSPRMPLELVPFLLLLVISACKKQDSAAEKDDSGYEGFVMVPSSKTNIRNSNDLPETQTENHLIWDSYYHGGGVSAGDVNHDGLVDLYFTNTMKENALYINKGGLVFEEVTSKAGVGGGKGVNWGSTMADINGDGWLDIYVCKSGPYETADLKRNKCYINQKDGTFKEMAKSMGIDNAGFSLQAAFFDYDLDQDLDLFIMNQPNNNRAERMKYINGNENDYINETTSDRLFRNEGNMKFTDVSDAAGVVSFRYGLGLKICDLNGDHWPDIYVASDYEWPDKILINNHDGTFTNRIHDYFKHLTYFSMGIDIGDINNDALDDVFVLDMAGLNHLRSKTNMPSMNADKFWKLVAKGNHYQYMFNVLQLNMGQERFSDISFMAGTSKTDWSWSALMMDADNDGYQDIYVTNGIKRDITNNDFSLKFMDMIDHKTVPEDLKKVIDMIPSNPMANLIFHNEGHLHFKDKAADWGLGQLSFSNGCVYADIDQDGDLDLVVNNVDAEAFVYENKANDTDRKYIQFDLKSTKSGRPVEGTRVTLYARGQLLQSQYFHPVRGFMSSSEPLVHFGLGSLTAIDSVLFIWPDQNISRMDQPALNQRHVIDQDAVQKIRKFIPVVTHGDWATDHTDAVIPAFQHKENEYDDFKHQVLLPFRISTLGPGLAVADVNGDQLEDFFVGGAAGQSSALYLQDKNGKFNLAPAQSWFAGCDVLGALFVDIDGDQDKDLYLATGGSELDVDDRNYIDLLYMNDGKGGFSLTANLPNIPTSTKAIASGDWDGDGDLDLFVGSRNLPRKYPYPDESYFLRNDKGKFTEVTKQVLTGDAQLGMIADAQFADKDKDGDLDLLICGDWIAPTWFLYQDGKFTRQEFPGLAAQIGWWNKVELADINGDGYMDILAGNAGLNNKFKASKEEPFIVLGSDFDHNGNSDIVLATHFDGKEVPVRGRECSSQQLPYIAEEFPTYEGFAKASLQEIIGKEKIKGSLRLELTQFRNGIFWGKADGDYTWEAFPLEAQISPIVGFVVADANGDGTQDVIAAGNLYDMEVETTRYDAGEGCIMSWSAEGWTCFTPRQAGFYAAGNLYDMEVETTRYDAGEGCILNWTSEGWACHTPRESGFYAGGNIRALKPIHSGDQTSIILARGNDRLSLFRIGKPVVQ